MVKNIVRFSDDVLNNKAVRVAGKIPTNTTTTKPSTSTTRLISSLDDSNIKINRVLDDRIKNFVPESANKWKRFDELKKIRSGEFSLGGGESNALARYTKPYYKYNKMLKKVDNMAVTYGFKNEADLARKIENAANQCRTINGKIKINDSPTWRGLFLRLKKTKNKGKKLAYAVGTGTVAGLVIELAKEQKKNTGCFRYKLGEEEKGGGGGGRKNLIKYKVGGNFCISDDVYNEEEDDNDNDDKSVRILPPSNHPLFNHKKWSCDYDDFYKNGNDIDRDRIDEIRKSGCNGLCDVLNFNTLTSFTNNEYQPLLDEKEEKKDDDEEEGEKINNSSNNNNDNDNALYPKKNGGGNNGVQSKENQEEKEEFMYVCEKATFLRTLINETKNVVDHVLDDVSLLDDLTDILFKFVILIIILYFGFKLITSQVLIPWRYQNQSNNYYHYYPNVLKTSNV